MDQPMANEAGSGSWWQRAYRAGELEALLFVSPRPLSVRQLAKRLGVDEAFAAKLLEEYAEALSAPGRGLQLRESAAGWRLETKAEHEDLIRAARAERGERLLSAPALEVLSVLVVRQPVTTEDVGSIRGVDSTATLDTLYKRGLIAKTRDPSFAKGVSWRTTEKFLALFSLKSLADLYQGEQFERIFGTSYKEQVTAG